MKVIYAGETKRVPEIQKFEELVQYAAKIFAADQLQSRANNDLKLFYQDDEGDIISVTCQSDLEEGYRVMMGRIKFVFSQDEDQARTSLQAKGGQAMLNNESFNRSEHLRPSMNPSMLDRSGISHYQSDFGAGSMNSRNMMGLMFEAFLQNQIDSVVRQRIQGVGQPAMLPPNDLGLQPSHNQMIEQAQGFTREKFNEDTKQHTEDTKERNIESIVKELDEEEDSLSAAKHCLQQENVVEETLDTKHTLNTPTQNCDCVGVEIFSKNNCNCEEGDIKFNGKPTHETPKRKCNCDEGDLCFKCILSKVFSLQPMLDQGDDKYEAKCVNKPEEFIGVAGADFSAKSIFKNTGKIEWPKNVLLKLILRLDKGTAVFYRNLGLEQESVLPQEELSVMIDLKLPEKQGKYSVSFRLVHTSKVEFGDEVTVNLQVQPKPEIACNTGASSVVSTLATNEQQLNVTSACSIPVDEEANSDDSCQSENEMNVSITSWDIIGDYDDAACDLGSIQGNEDENLGQRSVMPNKSEGYHTLQEKQQCQTDCCQTACCEQQTCCEQDCCQQEQCDEESEEDSETLLYVIATGCADFGRDCWAIWKGTYQLPSNEADSELIIMDQNIVVE